VSIDVVRAEWARAYEELEAQRDDRRRYLRLLAAVDAVTDALRARVGQTFTTAELLDAYEDVDRWGREAVSERSPYDGWPRDLVLVADAAFHSYARAAVDFEP